VDLYTAIIECTSVVLYVCRVYHATQKLQNMFYYYVCPVYSIYLFNYRLPLFVTADLMNYRYSYRGNLMSSFELSMRSAAKHLFRDY